MYNLHATIATQSGKGEWSVGPITLDQLNEQIKFTLTENKEATSFMFTIVPVRG